MKRRLLFILVILAIHLLPGLSAAGEEHFLTDEAGRKIKLSGPAKRIVSLAPNVTEILFSLGLGKEIAGVTDFCDYPEAVLSKPRIGGFVNPDIEKIVSLKPDLIIGTRDGNRAGAIQRIEELGLSVYLVDPKDFDGVVLTVRNIGQIAGGRDESKRIADHMVEKKEEIIRLTRSLARPRVFFQVGSAPIITVGKGTLADDLIRLAGGRSISENESANYPLYSIESIISKAPEIIIMTSMEGEKEYPNLVKKWQRWKSIPAVKRNAIYVLDSNLVDRPSPRIVDGLEALLRIIHPEVMKKN
jgi:iron complex transport system substrate-binding protein